MKLSRRGFLHLAAGAAALPAASHFAWAQAYPTRPVRIMVASPPGGTADFLARLTGQWLSERLGKPFVVENRQGAGTNIAAEAVANATPDGYMLLLVNPAHTLNATLYDTLSFNSIRDIAPVAGLLRAPNVMEVHPSVPVKTVPEFIAYAKANPGKINYASAGTGTLLHVAGELFKMMAGIDMVHVPYRGTAPALTDLLGGQVQMMCDNISTSIEHIRAGKLRALAVTTANRVEALSDIPGSAEVGIMNSDLFSWWSVHTPKGVPKPILDKLEWVFNQIAVEPDTKAFLAKTGSDVFPGNAKLARELLVKGVKDWGGYVKLAKIEPLS
jgi:tripartite-type tricarboxylate transporter receptor subunit TctC